MIQKLKNGINKVYHYTTLNKQFMLIYIVAIFLPVLFLDTILVSSINKYEENVKLRKVEGTAEQVILELGNIVKEVSLMGNNIYTDNYIFQFCNHIYKSTSEYKEAGSVFESISGLRYYSSVKEVKNITIYVDNESFSDTKYFKRLDDEVRNEWWYKKFIFSGTPILMMEDLSRKENSIYQKGTGTLSIIRRLDYFRKDREMILVVDLDYDELYKNIIKTESDSDIYICNSNRILFTNDDSILSRDSLPVIQAIRKEGISACKEFPAIGEKWDVYVLTNEVAFWYTIMTSKQLFILVFCINLILPVAIIRKITSSIIKRLKLLEEHFDGLQEQKFDLIEEPFVQDEIGQLYHHYNTTVIKTRKLFQTIIDKNNEKNLLEVSKKQAELNALISQVNPHFMYNTLECIYMRSIIKGESETADVILSLSSLLRQISKWNKDVIELEEELNLVEKYLQIQKYRFDDKLDFDIYLDEQCKKQFIPKMAIVSFVENACVHGIEESLEHGRIDVKVWQEDGSVKIEIKDSGCGIEESVLKLIRVQLENANIELLYNSKSTGVLNAYIRLKMYFDTNFQFYIDSKVNEGTTIQIHLNNTLT